MEFLPTGNDLFSPNKVVRTYCLPVHDHKVCMSIFFFGLVHYSQQSSLVLGSDRWCVVQPISLVCPAPHSCLIPVVIMVVICRPIAHSGLHRRLFLDNNLSISPLHQQHWLDNSCPFVPPDTFSSAISATTYLSIFQHRSMLLLLLPIPSPLSIMLCKPPTNQLPMETPTNTNFYSVTCACCITHQCYGSM